MRRPSTIAVIPARGGSKRIPRKNIYPVRNKPMIGWVIETAHASGVFEDVVVSSEDDEILSIAREFGATTYERPKNLADDHTHVMPVIYNFLETLETKPETVCLIYPTALLMKVEHLNQAMEMLGDPLCESILPVCEFGSPIQRAYKLGNSNFLQMAHPEYQPCRSQDLEKRFRDCGSFYWWKLAINEPRISPLFLSNLHCVDIDCYDDLKLALTLFDMQHSESRCSGL